MGAAMLGRAFIGLVLSSVPLILGGLVSGESHIAAPTTAPAGLSLDNFELAADQIEDVGLGGNIDEYQADVEFVSDLRLGYSEYIRYKVVGDQGELDEAVKHLERACELRPSSTAAQLYAGEVCTQEGHCGDSVRHLLKIPPDAPEYTVACRELSFAFADMAEMRVWEGGNNRGVATPPHLVAPPQNFYLSVPTKSITQEMRQEWLEKSKTYLQLGDQRGLSKADVLYALAYASWCGDAIDEQLNGHLSPATFQEYADYLQNETVTALSWRRINRGVSLLDAYGISGIPEKIRQDLKPWKELGSIAKEIRSNAGALSNLPAQVIGEFPPNAPILSVKFEGEGNVAVTFAAGAKSEMQAAMSRVKECAWDPAKVQNDGVGVAIGQIPESQPGRVLREIKLPDWNADAAKQLTGEITASVATHGRPGFSPGSIRTFDEPWLGARVVEYQCAASANLIESLNLIEDARLAVRDSPAGFGFVNWEGTAESGKMEFALRLFFAEPANLPSIREIQ